MFSNELYHHGVKGMRWGHRKTKYTAAQTARFKQDVKTAKKHGIQADYSIDTKTGKVTWGQKTINGRKVSDKYATAVLKKVQRDTTVKALATTAVVSVGATAVGRILGSIS